MSKFLLSPQLAAQCCDAGSYIGYGQECAIGVACYGDLRPVGDYYWFSMPARLNLPIDYIIFANAAVMLLSIYLSVIALKRLAGYLKSGDVLFNRVVNLLLPPASFAAHAIFFHPTLFNSLSDSPAAGFVLSGVWLLMIAGIQDASKWKKAMAMAASGLCLGLAAWLRAFYLYPVLIIVAAYCLMWLFSKKYVWGELLILLALVPIGSQYVTMHQAYGTYSYIKEETSNSWTNMHLNQPFVGYDTVFPRNAYFWQPQHCTSSLGILNGLQAHDYKSLACVVFERFYFYFGTYRSDTYIFTDVKNQLVPQFLENIGDPNSDWFTQNLRWESDVINAPNGTLTADKLTVTEPDSTGRGDAVMWVMLRGNTPHTFSVWLWSPFPKTINLAIKRHYDDRFIALEKITLSPIPQRYSVTGTTLETAEYDVDIGRTPFKDHAITFGTEPEDYLYAWGAQLEVGERATEFLSVQLIEPDSVREWRPLLLSLNIILLLVVAAAIVYNRKFWLRQRSGLSIVIFYLAALAECLAIIPEQRFSIAIMVFMWLIAVLFVVQLVTLQLGRKQ